MSNTILKYKAHSIKEYVESGNKSKTPIFDSQERIFDGEALKSTLRTFMDIDTPIYDELKNAGRIYNS